jgi:uncharacterized protein YfdQ (DUF2303 family)
MTDENNNVQAAINAGLAMAGVDILLPSQPQDARTGDPVLAKIVPEGAKLELRDMEKYLPRPTRKRGHYVFTDAKSFVEFVNREKTPETIILANREGTSFKAVFNGNEAGNDLGGVQVDARPGWGDYAASYSCPHSPEWKIWKEANKNKMSQAAFAQFIEDNVADLIVPAATTDPYYTTWPTPEEMVAVSRGIEAKQDVNFGSAVRLDNGQVKFNYEETISGNVQGGQILIPQKFAVGIPVFAGTAPWQIIARLRYRIERGGLTMWFEFERLFKITERAFDEARVEIATGTGVPVYLGAKSGD